jgi:hypothetical protein
MRQTNHHSCTRRSTARSSTIGLNTTVTGPLLLASEINHFDFWDGHTIQRQDGHPFLNLIVGIFAYKSTNKNLAVLE